MIHDSSSVDHGASPGSQQTRDCVTEAEAAEKLGVSAAALEKWRLRGTGPSFVRVGRRIRYRLVELDRFLDAHAVHLAPPQHPPTPGSGSAPTP